MSKAIILGSGFVALGAIKALAAEGIDVIHLSPDKYDFACYSKYVKTYFKVPLPKNDTQSLLNVLMNTKERWDGSLLLPTDDDSVVFVSKNRDELQNRYIPVPQQWSILGRIIEKKALYEEAYKLDIPVPKVIIPDPNEDTHHNKKELSYPFILKPVLTPAFKAVFNKKVLIIKNSTQFEEKYREVRKHDLDVILSEIIPGPDHRLLHYRSYIDDTGDVLAEMCTSKIRQHPPDFGMACASKTIPMNETIRSLSLQLLRHFSYRGESSVEFKLDPRDNRYKLIEINVRPVLPESHHVAAGINFPYITYMDLVRNEKIRRSSYSEDLYWIHNLTDAREFVRSMFTFKLNWREFLHPYRQKKVFCIPLFEDPMPFVMTLKKFFRTLPGTFNNRLHGNRE